MAFVSWAQMLSDFKDALANRRMESFFQASVENSQEMRTTWTKLGNLTAFQEWLEYKAAEESKGDSAGTIPFAVGGY